MARRAAVLALILALVPALLAGVVAAHRVVGGQRSPGVTAPDASSGRSASVLVLLSAADGSTSAAALLAHDPATRTASGLLLPAHLLLPVAGRGAVQLDRIGPSGADDAAAAGALSDVLGVRVDATWRLNPRSLAGLVDGAGGVSLRTDAPVVNRVGRMLAPGEASLVGVAAAAYALLRSPEEPDQAGLARFSAVLQAVLRGLPADGATLADRLRATGAAVIGSSAPQRVLAAVAAAARSDSLTVQGLPVRTIDSGGGAPLLAPDHDGVTALVRARLGGLVLTDPPSGAVRVLVQNASGTPASSVAARSRLVAAGLRYVDGGPPWATVRARSVVLVPEDTAGDRARAGRVAAALGLPGSAVEVSATGQVIADVVVVLGSDAADGLAAEVGPAGAAGAGTRTAAEVGAVGAAGAAPRVHGAA